MNKILLPLLGILISVSLSEAKLNAENGNTNGWSIYDKSPSGAKIKTIYDETVKAEVVSLQGDGIKNGYALGDWRSSRGWNNKRDKGIEWQMKYQEKFIIYVPVITDKGLVYLIYTSAKTDQGILSNGKNIYFGLGGASKDGRWHTFERNLELDLQKFDPDNHILAVNGFLVRGSGKLYNIKTKQVNRPTTIKNASLGDKVWLDSNKNGIQDKGEQGVNNVLVALLDANGKVINQTRTDNKGLYRFNDLEEGEYAIKVTKPKGYNFTRKNNTQDNLDSDVATDTGISESVFLEENANNNTLDAGLIAIKTIKNGSVKVRVWEDINSNGYMDDRQRYRFDVSISLRNAKTHAVVASGRTATNGVKIFRNVKPGRYYISIRDVGGHVIYTRRWRQNDIAGRPQAKSNIFTINNNGNRVNLGGALKVIRAPRNGLITSPIVLDMNHNGKIDVTGATTSKNKSSDMRIGKTVEFDMFGDGNKIQIEWIKGDGDAFLVDNSDGKAISDMSGKRLFGDQKGKYGDGYIQLQEKDTNHNGKIDGKELDGLLLWFDNGDAKAEKSEFKTLQEVRIMEINTERNDIENSKGELLMQSFATNRQGQKILTEDIWFLAK